MMWQTMKAFITLMLAALLSGAIWLHFATAIGAPVSTTHAIVGGILGAGIAAGGFGVANWRELGNIAMSWVISPLAGGVIAALLLYFIKNAITYKQNKKQAARRVVPYLIAFMTWAFSLYLINKGLKKIIVLDNMIVFGISLVIAVVVFLAVKPMIAEALENMENKKEEINKLFTIPLIFSAALLSFAHGANDVANAIGPLAAIYDALKSGFSGGAEAAVPFWIMLLGGLGISIGLALFGPKLIKTVGSEITELDQIRAFCIAMSAALTVLVASELGMPVSSTHIAVGAVFGVGFLREYLKKRYKEMELKMPNMDTTDTTYVGYNPYMRHYIITTNLYSSINSGIHTAVASSRSSIAASQSSSGGGFGGGSIGGGGSFGGGGGGGRF